MKTTYISAQLVHILDERQWLNEKHSISNDLNNKNEQPQFIVTKKRNLYETMDIF